LRKSIQLYLVLFVGLFLLAFLASFSAKSLPSRSAWNERYTVEEVVRGLEYVKELKRDVNPEADFIRLGRAFTAAQEAYELPALFLVSIGWHESRYKTEDVGTLGEVGIMQVGPMGRTDERCRDACGEMVALEDQIMCGACWLRVNVQWCKDHNRGFNGYATGKCDPKSEKAKSKIRRRYNLWKKTHDHVRSK